MSHGIAGPFFLVLSIKCQGPPSVTTTTKTKQNTPKYFQTRLGSNKTSVKNHLTEISKTQVTHRVQDHSSDFLTPNPV